jgi:hypothetical protein
MVVKGVPFGFGRGDMIQDMGGDVIRGGEMFKLEDQTLEKLT